MIGFPQPPRTWEFLWTGRLSPSAGMVGNRSQARVGPPEVHVNDHFSAHLQSVYPGVDASHASPYMYATAVLGWDDCAPSNARVDVVTVPVKASGGGLL